MDPEFWDELTANERWGEVLPDKTENVAEDQALLAAEDDEDDEDDSEVGIGAVIASVVDGKVADRLAPCESGSLMSIGVAESLDESNMIIEPSTETGAPSASQASKELGPGKRKRMPNRLYRAKDFWRHNVDDESDVEAEEWEDEAVSVYLLRSDGNTQSPEGRKKVYSGAVGDQ